MTVHISAIQMASGTNLDANLNEAARLIEQTAEAGAKLCVLPENFAFMGSDAEQRKLCEPASGGKIQQFLAQQAEKHCIWIVGGTMPLQARASDKVRAACLVFDDKGQQQGRYDKIHLFDVQLTERDQDRYTESALIEAGSSIQVLDTPFGRLGLAICYDLRFPELFRQLSAQGAEIIALPSAFTATTGKAHWETLVRARAIENLCFVVAANQGGYHVDGRETYGDSMIVDPWGQVLARHPKHTGLACATCDLSYLRQLRERFPVLSHRRLFCQDAD